MHILRGFSKWTYVSSSYPGKITSIVIQRNSWVYAFVFFLSCQADAGFRSTEIEIAWYHNNKHYTTMYIYSAKFYDKHSFVLQSYILLAMPPFLHIGHVNKVIEDIPPPAKPSRAKTTRQKQRHEQIIHQHEFHIPYSMITFSRRRSWSIKVLTSRVWQ